MTNRRHADSAPFWLTAGEVTPFPPVELALREPDGLLAIGGDLSVERLLLAYRHGIFPWYDAGQPILWWSPDPRCVLFPEQLNISRSLRKTLRSQRYEVTMDQAFVQVMRACAAPRARQSGTWIQPEMIAAYAQLHDHGFAHSVETWLDGELVGGLYGIAIGKVFFGESMFSRQSDASKVAFVQLVQRLHAAGYGVIDCQVYNPHLASLGAVCIPRTDFIELLSQHVDKPDATPWAVIGPHE